MLRNASEPLKEESLEVLKDKTATSISLSYQNSTRLEDYLGPHKYAATTMGSSSLYAINRGCCDADHKPQNYWLLKMAP